MAHRIPAERSCRDEDNDRATCKDLVRCNYFFNPDPLVQIYLSGPVNVSYTHIDSLCSVNRTCWTWHADRYIKPNRQEIPTVGSCTCSKAGSVPDFKLMTASRNDISPAKNSHLMSWMPGNLWPRTLLFGERFLAMRVSPHWARKMTLLYSRFSRFMAMLPTHNFKVSGFFSLW